jgi:MFS family permease
MAHTAEMPTAVSRRVTSETLAQLIQVFPLPNRRRRCHADTQEMRCAGAISLGLAGFFLGVASSGLIALAPLLYATALRSTGVGWAMGLGRLGSFVGTLAIGLLFSRGWQVDDSFVAIGAPALCAAICPVYAPQPSSRLRAAPLYSLRHCFACSSIRRFPLAMTWFNHRASASAEDTDM